MARLCRACWSATFAKQEEPAIDPAAARNLSYGLFVLTAKEDQDNGCIINTCVQVANQPTRLAISCQKENLTREMISRTGKFNVSVLTEDVPFETIRHFGMQTGREVRKLDAWAEAKRSHNGLLYLTEHTNAFFSCEVKESTDLGSHVLFIAEVTEAQVLDSKPSCTYAHYHKAIKPRF